MSRRCGICGKKPQIGSSITRRGLPKKKGGVGLKTTGISRRVFLPNLQAKRVVFGTRTRKMLVCTKCIKSGKLTFASSQPAISDN